MVLKMMSPDSISRRSLFALAAAGPFASKMLGAKRIPLGLELYSVRNELKKDLMGTVRAVAKMGYEGVEFFSPYFSWTPSYAKEVRKLQDDLGIRCFSTHNDASSLTAENLPRAIELNQIIGSKFIVMASSGDIKGSDHWKIVADRLNQAAEKTKAAGLRVGYHNHDAEFRPVDGHRPLEFLAANTSKDVMLQLDIGTCLEAGSDPVAWIEQHPGRIRSIHCKDWSSDPKIGYKALFSEGAAPWKEIFAAAEKVGGVEFYLIEQEEGLYPAMECVERSLANFKKLRSA
jgi:sugar phosphate isomerase/epimerase